MMARLISDIDFSVEDAAAGAGNRGHESRGFTVARRSRRACPIRPPWLDAGNFVSEDQAMIWFEHPPVSVIDWAKPGKIRQVSSVEAAAEAEVAEDQEAGQGCDPPGRCDGGNGQSDEDEESV
jgi:hypothetical protein